MPAQRSTILVTGSSGLIGSAVCQRLVPRYDIVGFDKDPPTEPIDGVDFVEVDLTSVDDVVRRIETVRDRHGDRCASVLHLAAYYDFAGEPSPLYDEVTVRGTGRLLTAVTRRMTVEQFLFTSTMLVHAPTTPGHPINEDGPIETKWDYPQSKVKTEALLECEHGTVPVVLLRVAGVYDDEGHSIPIGQQIKRIAERQITSHVYPGDTSHGQAFVHLDDVVEAIALCIERRRDLPGWLPLLIGEDQTLSYDELQRTLGLLIHGEEWTTQQIPKPVAKAGAWVQDKMPVGEEPFIKPWMIDLADDHYELDITCAAQTIGWRPQHSLRETLPIIVGALKSDPIQFYETNKLGEPPKDDQEREEQPISAHGDLKDLRNPPLAS